METAALDALVFMESPWSRVLPNESDNCSPSQDIPHFPSKYPDMLSIQWQIKPVRGPTPQFFHSSRKEAGLNYYDLLIMLILNFFGGGLPFLLSYKRLNNIVRIRNPNLLPISEQLGVSWSPQEDWPVNVPFVREFIFL
jgi:hypothetical protein